jgi:hypothetical protein
MKWARVRVPSIQAIRYEWQYISEKPKKILTSKEKKRIILFQNREEPNFVEEYMIVKNRKCPQVEIIDLKEENERLKAELSSQSACIEDYIAHANLQTTMLRKQSEDIVNLHREVIQYRKMYNTK